MKSTLSFINITFFLLPSFLWLRSACAAFTTPVERNGDYIDQNDKGTWCFYPDAIDPTTIDVACVGTGKADYARVMEAHLNNTTSINYFSASLEYLGGPEWVVDTRGANRKIYLCMTGRAGDYTYQTMCTTVGKDNSLGNGGPSPYCKVHVGQKRVTDGCYIPNQEIPTFTVSTTRKPAIVTITRTSGTEVSTTLAKDPLPAITDTGLAIRSAGAGPLLSLSITLVTLALCI